MTRIYILGTGCPKCKKLAENTAKAVAEMKGDYEIIKVTDINKIMKFGAIITPALAVDGEIKSAGKAYHRGNYQRNPFAYHITHWSNHNIRNSRFKWKTRARSEIAIRINSSRATRQHDTTLDWHLQTSPGRVQSEDTSQS